MVPLNGGKDIGEVRCGQFGESAYPVWKFAYMRGSKAAWRWTIASNQVKSKL